MRILTIYLCILCTIHFGYAQSQYVEQGVVLVQRIIEDLSSFENGSPAQDSALQKVMVSLVIAMRNDSLIINSKEKQTELFNTGRMLQGRYGPFSVLRPAKKPNGWISDWRLDTISVEVEALKRRLEVLQDSFVQIRKECEAIFLNPEQPPITRSIALDAFMQISDPADYSEQFFSEYSNMSWGVIDEINDAECYGCDRDILQGWYFSRNWHEDPVFRNWKLVPVAIKYWGDPEWNKNNTKHFTGTDLEQLVFYLLLQGYERPDLLLEFIQVNAKDSNTKILNKLREGLD